MRVATDIGGTFTDLVAVDEKGVLYTEKSNTTPPHFENGVIDVFKKVNIDPKAATAFIHGTTTIINALTERKGAKTALITTSGFRDVLEIARANRPDLFNLVFSKPAPFIERCLRFEVEERIDSDGGILTALNIEQVRELIPGLKKLGVTAVAICFINSYTNDKHEKEAAAEIKKLMPEAFVSTSGEVTREWREYERTSTVALNAYVGPVASAYLDKLETKLSGTGVTAPKYVMQSNGGAVPFTGAKNAPIHMVESGPVAGVFGAKVLGNYIDEKNLIAFDVGGTTAKCSLIDQGEVKITTSYRIERNDRNAGYPIMVPVVDIVEIGNGGGSIAWIDATGSLKVGPQSAGALPGPVAYGLGGNVPTTTDACLVTGRLSKKNFDFPVDMKAVEKALDEKVGTPLALGTKDAAVGVIRVAEANMYNALKLISVRRGYDPRDFVLVAFGGGGPMHAASLARELGIRKVIVPVAASVFAAWGMLMTDMRHDYIQTNITSLENVSPDEIESMWKALKIRADNDFREWGVKDSNKVISYYADLRYAGQEHTVKVSVPPPSWNEAVKGEIANRFHETHEHNYTFRLSDTPIEIVNLHLAVYGSMEKPQLKKIAKQTEPLEKALLEKRSVYFTGDGFIDVPVYDRAKLFAGAVITGPLLVEEKAASTLVYQGQNLTVDDFGNLIISAVLAENNNKGGTI
ncbi:5-oxoprolinase [Spirochaetia bacterium]|nr:5-oxoprolinase [Spirochaetia bacterium]